MNNDFITVFLGNGGAITTFNLPNIDIVMDYYIANPSYYYTPFSSDLIKETIYHELTHASEFTKAGYNWYTGFFTAEATELGHWVGHSAQEPYGDGTSANSPIIALGEALAYHMGFFLAGQRYGSNGDPGKASQNGGTTGYDLVALEVFDPNRAADVFKWIPKGLMLDLIDDTPIEATVNDKVSGYTNQQIFGALQSDVTRMSDYKAKLLLLYGTVQQTQINNLFASYHY